MWKAYFFIYTPLFVLGTLVLLFKEEATGLLLVPDLIATIIFCVGMYSFAFKKKLAERIFWKRFWWISLGITLIEIISNYTTNSFIRALYSSHTHDGSSLWSVTLGYLFAVPMFYMIYSLAFKKLKKPRPSLYQGPYSNFAVASLITGLIGVFIPILLTLPSAILGIIALQHIERDKSRGKAMAWFGISMLLLHVLMATAFIGYSVVLAFTSDKDANASTVSGKNAIEHMNEVELRYLHRNLEKIHAESTVEEVSLLLGEPDGVMNLHEYGKQFIYACPQAPHDDCTIRVNFLEDKVYEVRWKYEGKFDYVTDLKGPTKTI
jgi:hypothetical protein